MFDALTSVAGITLLSNQRIDHSPHPSSTQHVGSESRESTADFELCPGSRTSYSSNVSTATLNPARAFSIAWRRLSEASFKNLAKSF